MSEANTEKQSTSESGGPDMSHLSGKYMTFKLANEEYGLEILRVREIIGLMNITPVPKAADFIRGIINLRGKVEPVVDLRMKFGIEKTDPTDQTVIIVVQYKHRGGEISMGILVDEVLEVLNIASQNIEPPPNFGLGDVDADFILGIGKYGKRVIFLLDIGKILSAEDSDLVEQVSTMPMNAVEAEKRTDSVEV
jgi:purine-binding chemotaxis protein CheW